MTNLGHQLFTGNAFNHAKKEVGKEIIRYILGYREASNQVVADFPIFISFLFSIHVCFSVFFLLLSWVGEHGDKQIKFKIQFFS